MTRNGWWVRLQEPGARGERAERRGIPLLLPALVLAAALPALPGRAQNAAEPGFPAVQQQVEALRSGMIDSTVAVRIAGGSGSGVIISPDGLVLSAAHVVGSRPGRRLSVTLADGRSFQAAVLGSDSETDLGLMKITGAANLPAAPLGDSAVLRRRQWVLATGHPLGMHTGRPPVLRIGRVLSLPLTNSRSRSFLTDAPIISGDSGGPLFDLQGRVVGIHSMVNTPGRRLVSIHAPVNLAKVAIDLAKQGEAPAEWDRSPNFTAALREGEQALLARNTALAVTRVKEAASLDPCSAQARLVLARALARGGEKEPAIAALREACDLGFSDPVAIRQDADLAPLARDARVDTVLKRLDALEGIAGQRKNDILRAGIPTPRTPDAARGTVRIQAGGKDVALATIMSADGNLLTKASELPAGVLAAVLPDGRRLPVTRGKVDAAWDVALLKVKATGLQPVPLAGEAAVGQWTFSADSTPGTSQLGVVGVATMPVLGRGIAPRPTSKAYMGVRLGAMDPRELRDLGVPYGVGVDVEPDLPAARAGVHTGDVIVKVDGFPAHDPDAVMDTLVGKQPGQSVKLQLLRNGERLNVTVQLATRPANLPGRGNNVPAMLSGDVSRMQGPFPVVLQHDTVLQPGAMGGPVLNIDGRCLGLNIARADRTSTYAIPVRELREIYARLSGAAGG